MPLFGYLSRGLYALQDELTAVLFDFNNELREKFLFDSSAVFSSILEDLNFPVNTVA